MKTDPENSPALEPVRSHALLDDDTGYEHTEELNGVTAFVFNVKNRGQQITVSGWHPNHHKFKTGERVLLIQKSGEATRYRIKEVRRPGDPHDQYFMDCEFTPRTQSSSVPDQRPGRQPKS
jgi:hypothetical protein